VKYLSVLFHSRQHWGAASRPGLVAARQPLTSFS
jgi:hypothetical protein